MDNELLVKLEIIDIHSDGIESIATNLQKFNAKLLNTKSKFNGGTPLDNDIIQSITKLTNQTDNIISKLNLFAKKNKNFTERIASFEKSHSTEKTSNPKKSNSICDYQNEDRFKYDGMSILAVLNSLGKNEKLYTIDGKEITKDNYKSYKGQRVYVKGDSGINGTNGNNVTIPNLKALKESELKTGYSMFGGKLDSAEDLVYPVNTPEYIISKDGKLKKVNIEMKFNQKNIGYYNSGGIHAGDDLHVYMKSGGNSVKGTKHTPVNAIAGGLVVEAGWNKQGFGNNVVILSQVGDDYVLTTYAHLENNTIKVKAGDIVTNETVIANIGSTGNSTGAHLHLETEVIKGNSLSSDEKELLNQLNQKFVTSGEKRVSQEDIDKIYDKSYGWNNGNKIFDRYSPSYKYNKAGSTEAYKKFAKETFLIEHSAEYKDKGRVIV